MLQIKHISKQYKTGDLIQNALNDVSLNLRDNEFVSILGPSGSGKTTLLNIIGGLDRYDSGDLVINDVSTVRYKDRDWDSYRNHTIGFVFQSYNLIPHQTVLSNVELALTIGGISKRERKERALKALEEVGLRDQAHKRPNQMSGGQMQRVAIARALVNNPDILLADEPTGALDTETSVQVMELLKKVANDRLVIMVTHNPELAEEYSTRIVKLRDGKIIGDTNPFVPEVKEGKVPFYKNLGKASMSMWTALSLSFNNLLTKKGRTILTAFAGSIGIIGIALILSLSTGFQNYIDKIQEDTLTSYPLTITAETADTASMLLSMVSEQGKATGKDTVVERQYISTMFSKIGTNDLKSLKKHLEKNDDKVNDMVSFIDYQYSVVPMIYTVDNTKAITQVNPSTMMSSMMGGSSMMSSMSGMSTAIFNEMIDNQESLEQQYKVLEGRWPKAYNELLLVLPEENGMSDLLVYGMGLRDDQELMDMISKIMAGKPVENTNEPLQFTYKELLELEYKLVDPTDTYKYNETYGVYESMTGNADYMKKVYEEAESLKVVGIVCAKKSGSTGNLQQGIAYTKELTEYVIKKASKSEIVKKQMENQEVDVFSNKRFDDKSQEMGLNFEDMITVDTQALASAFGGKISEKDISDMTKGYMNQISAAITTDTSKAEKAFSDTLVTLSNNLVNGYIAEHKDASIGGAKLKLSSINSVVDSFMAKADTQKLLENLEKEYVVPKATFQATYAELLKGLLQVFYGVSPSPTDSEPTAILKSELLSSVLSMYVGQQPIVNAVQQMGAAMTQAAMQKTILTKVGELTGALVTNIAKSMNVDPNKIASAFKFDLTEEELMRLMQTMSTSSVESNAELNLISLGYQDLDKPSNIAFYFIDFDSKEAFLDFLEDYNTRMEKKDDSKVIKYTDLTGLLMSSVKTIVDSVSYVLIAFVSISLIVSSIMIGIITYISVLERTKEIGVLRAIGASKKNISSIFNAETFIVGLFSGLIGIGVTLALVPPINFIIHTLTGNTDINAVLPVTGAVVLVILSVLLTLIGGLIPSKQAAKKDPVLALRSE